MNDLTKRIIGKWRRIETELPASFFVDEIVEFRSDGSQFWSYRGSDGKDYPSAVRRYKVFDGYYEDCGRDGSVWRKIEFSFDSGRLRIKGVHGAVTVYQRVD